MVGRLTDEEHDLLVTLSRVVRDFTRLPIIHTTALGNWDDRHEFMAAIRQTQRILLARPALRAVEARYGSDLDDSKGPG